MTRISTEKNNFTTKGTKGTKGTKNQDGLQSSNSIFIFFVVFVSFVVRDLDFSVLTRVIRGVNSNSRIDRF
jgi:hypothetical protein